VCIFAVKIDQKVLKAVMNMLWIRWIRVPYFNRIHSKEESSWNSEEDNREAEVRSGSGYGSNVEHHEAVIDV
jgi:hypothetical protein